MKKKLQLILLLTAFTATNFYSQINFEKGYYIHNSGQKTDCLIKNNDWKNNPIGFEYKISENDETKTFSIKSIKEFGIYDNVKYIRKAVMIDRSSETIKTMSLDKNPIFKEEELYLKVLIEGKANLYFYEDGRLRRYFYNIENSNIEQLIFKSYLENSNNEHLDKDSYESIRKNNRFRQQIWTDLKCSTIKLNSVEKLEYKKNSLIHIFSQYNKCSNSDFINYGGKQNVKLFNLTLRPRLRSSSLALQNDTSLSSDIEFGNTLGFGFGVEAEFILPFNKNKWAISIEPTYQNFKANKTTDVSNVSGGKLIGEVKYNSIEVPVSIRHYFFLNKNSKIFVNASFVIDFTSKSSIEFKRADNSSYNTLDITTGTNLALGIGYKLNNKYGIEMRYQAGRDIIENYSFWSSSYKTLSVIFGYTLF
ncbi:MAG: tRNA modification GTPase [Flavobacteriaceae bacterium]